MAYEPKEWVCGETITADGLNNLEEGVQEALDCCGGGGDCGYSCTETQETVFEGSLTTSSMGSFIATAFVPTDPISSDSVIVTLNGTEYELPKVTISLGIGYGEADANGIPVFTNYPCAIGISNGQYYFFTPSASTNSVKIGIPNEVITTSDCFRKAVQTSSCFFVRVKFNGETFESIDKTFNEIADAVESKIPCFAIVEQDASGSPTTFCTCPIRGNRYSSFDCSYVFVGSDSDLLSTRVTIPSAGNPIISVNNIPLN